MKKLIGTVAVAALLATAAFADGISFGSWGRGLFVIGNGQSEDDLTNNSVSSWIAQSWGKYNGSAPRTALGVSGSSDHVGFILDIHGNGNGLGMGDNALIWVKPVEMVKVILAAPTGTGFTNDKPKNDQNWLRSDAAFGLWNWSRLGVVDMAGASGEGFIFPAMLNKTIAVSVEPIEGLFVAWGFNPQYGNAQIKEHDYDTGDRLIDQLGRTSSIAASFKIGEIGTVKAGVQFMGKYYNKDMERKDRMEIDAAFELTGLEKVYVSVGTKIPLIGNYNATGDAAPIQLNVYGRLNFIENMAIHVISGFKFNNADAWELDRDGHVGFMVGGGVDFSLSNGISFFADARFATGVYIANSSEDHTSNFVFGFGASKGFSNGLIGVAFEGSTNAYGRNAYAYDGDLAWEIPVKFEYWF